jgi:predicted MFS family arabinose efflux permease
VNTDGWWSARIVAGLAAAAVLLAAFVVVQRRSREPMLPLDLFRRPAFVGAQVAAVSISATFFALFLYITLYLQEILHLSPFRAGLVYLPGTMLIFVVSGASAQLATRFRPSSLIVSGLVLVAAGLALMAVAGTGSSWAALLPGELVACAGTGLVNPALAALALGAVERDRAGLAAGVNDAFRQGAITLGVAAFGTVVSAHAALGHGDPVAYVDGLHHALIAAAVLTAIGAAACWRLLGGVKAGWEQEPEPVADLV